MEAIYRLYDRGFDLLPISHRRKAAIGGSVSNLARVQTQHAGEDPAALGTERIDLSSDQQKWIAEMECFDRF